MNRFLLYLIMLPSGLWERMGADPVQLRAILNVKLMLDDRRPLNMGRPQKKKNQRFRTIWAMVISCLTGFMCSMPLFYMDQLLSGLWTYFSVFILLLSITLITDFSTVLVDTKDKYILLPRPISDRTLFLSRSLHIFVYLFRVMLPMSLPGWITLGFISGWKAVLWFPVPALALLFTALFVVLGAYLLILRLAPPNKFQEVLSYFQIFFSITIFGVYYLMPRAVDSIRLQHFQVSDFSWAPFTPTYWFASTFSWVTHLDGGRALPLLGLLALIFPLFCAWATLRFLAPQFTSVLSDLDFAGQDIPMPGSSAKAQNKSKSSQRLSVLLNRRTEAQAGFLLTWIQTSRSRAFKMKVYPMFAYVPIYFLYLMLQQHRPLTRVWEELPGSGKHIVLLYMCSIVMLSTLGYLNVSEQYKAAWAYRATPINEPGALMSGAFKVIWIKYFLPFFIAISAFVLYVWGWTAISDILLAMVNITLFAAFLGRMMYRRFPFSMLEPSMKSGSRFFKAMFGMSIPLFMGLLHYLALDMLWLKFIFVLLSAAMLYLVWESYAHTPWSVIYQEEEGIKMVEPEESL
jgi:hypothetical protein